MRTNRWKLIFGVVLVCLSAILYGVHFALFEDSHHIFVYLVGDIAFVPLEVLLVTLILHQVLESREHRAKIQKLNMAIGIFFAEMGTDLLARLRNTEQSAHAEHVCLTVTGAWKEKEFEAAQTQIAGMPELLFSTAPARLQTMREFLAEKRSFLLSLLENPNLLEHEAFTDLLWATFHLTDELSHRTSFEDLPDTDRKHLNGDIERVFRHLLSQWVAYMRHLKNDYPYLFSLAVRVNPFNPNADPVVRG